MADAVREACNTEGTLQIAALVLGALVVVALVSTLSRPPALPVEVQELVHSAAQFHEMAKQDSDPAIALQHSTQALVTLQLARRLASDDTLMHACHVRPKELEAILLSTQAACIGRVSPRDPTLTSLAAGWSRV